MTIVFQKYLGSLAKTLYYSMDHNIKHVLDYQSTSDILSQQDILLSVNSGSSSIDEARGEKGLPFRINYK